MWLKIDFVTEVPSYLEKINEILMRHASALKNPGLFHGKMGISLYFFYLARHTKNPDHQNFAETLLDEVYEYIQNNKTTCGFADGLAGLAWAIIHLIENGFVEADADEVLSDADDQIYFHLHQTPDLNFGFPEGLLGYLTYVVAKISWRRQSGLDSDFVFERLLTDLWNRASIAIEDKRWRSSEPPFFNLNWDLPLLLVVLGQTMSLHFYENKLSKIIRILNPLVLSCFPYHHANKLYLSYSITQVLKSFDLPAWKRHADMIREEADLPLLLGRELGDKNIFLSNGLAGVSFISQELGHAFFTKIKHQTDITEKILQSQYFHSITGGDPDMTADLGLLNGLTGIGFLLLLRG